MKMHFIGASVHLGKWLYDF